MGFAYKKMIKSTQDLSYVLRDVIDVGFDDEKKEKHVKGAIFYYIKTYPDYLFTKTDKKEIRSSIKNYIGKSRMNILLNYIEQYNL